MKWLRLASMLSVALPAIVLAQTTKIERQITGPPDTNIGAEVFTAIKEDCTTGPLPVVRLLTPPAHGNVTMMQASVKATNKCAGGDFPAFATIYRSTKDFIGQDDFSLEAKIGSATEIIQFTVTIR